MRDRGIQIGRASVMKIWRGFGETEQRRGVEDAAGADVVARAVDEGGRGDMAPRAIASEQCLAAESRRRCVRPQLAQRAEVWIRRKRQGLLVRDQRVEQPGLGRRAPELVHDDVAGKRREIEEPPIAAVGRGPANAPERREVDGIGEAVLPGTPPKGVGDVDVAGPVGDFGDEEVDVGRAAGVAGLAREAAARDPAAEDRGRAEGEPAQPDGIRRPRARARPGEHLSRRRGEERACFRRRRDPAGLRRRGLRERRRVGERKASHDRLISGGTPGHDNGHYDSIRVRAGLEAKNHSTLVP